MTEQQESTRSRCHEYPAVENTADEGFNDSAQTLSDVLVKD
jgi:hypothetical protein